MCRRRSASFMGSIPSAPQPARSARPGCCCRTSVSRARCGLGGGESRLRVDGSAVASPDGVGREATPSPARVVSTPWDRARRSERAAHLRRLGRHLWSRRIPCASLEIVWFRLLGVIVKSTTFTFGTLLAVYLAGLAAGSLAGTRSVARFRRPARGVPDASGRGRPRRRVRPLSLPWPRDPSGLAEGLPRGLRAAQRRAEPAPAAVARVYRGPRLHGSGTESSLGGGAVVPPRAGFPDRCRQRSSWDLRFPCCSASSRPISSARAARGRIAPREHRGQRSRHTSDRLAGVEHPGHRRHDQGAAHHQRVVPLAGAARAAAASSPSARTFLSGRGGAGALAAASARPAGLAPRGGSLGEAARRARRADRLRGGRVRALRPARRRTTDGPPCSSTASVRAPSLTEEVHTALGCCRHSCTPIRNSAVIGLGSGDTVYAAAGRQESSASRPSRSSGRSSIRCGAFTRILWRPARPAERTHRARFGRRAAT